VAWASERSTVFARNGAVASLLRQIIGRDLAVETVKGSDGQPRLRLHPPIWEDYVAVALDEIIAIAGSSWRVSRRVDRLLAGLIAIAPADRAEACRRASNERDDPPTMVMSGKAAAEQLLKSWCPRPRGRGALQRPPPVCAGSAHPA
jgi:hypothetical protein